MLVAPLHYVFCAPDARRQSAQNKNKLNQQEFETAVRKITAETNADLYKQINEIQNSLNFLTQKVSAGNNDDVTSLRADMLEINRKVDAVRNALSTGKGNVHTEHFNNNGPITADEYAKFLPKRLDGMSLGDVVLEDAKLAGVNVENTRELDAYLEGKRPSVAQLASEVRS